MCADVRLIRNAIFNTVCTKMCQGFTLYFRHLDEILLNFFGILHFEASILHWIGNLYI